MHFSKSRTFQNHALFKITRFSKSRDFEKTRHHYLEEVNELTQEEWNDLLQI